MQPEGGALRHRRKVMTLTPSVRAISLCNLPWVTKRSEADVVTPLSQTRFMGTQALKTAGDVALSSKEKLAWVRRKTGQAA
jgi:hypothetical protein